MGLPREFGHLQAILLCGSGVKDIPAWVCQAQSVTRDVEATGDPALWKRALAGRHSHAPKIEHALWWASMTVTSVGSSIVPETTLGKVCTALLATCGMTIFPIFTVYITSLVQRMNQSR